MIVLSRNMAYSVAYDVLNEANLLEDSRTQQEKVTDEHNYALREEKVETNSVIALKRTNEPDADDIKRLVNPEVYEFGDPNRYKEINKAFEDLNIALCEMQDALKLIEKPPEACLEEMNKFLQKNCDKLKEMTFVSNKEKERERDKEASKREDSANVASSSSSRVEVDVVVKSPNKKTGKELTENITAGVVVEPQPIEVKKEPKQAGRPLYRRNGEAEDSANVDSSSSSRVEVDVVVKSPNKKTGEEVTENITAGVVVEPQPIEVKKEPKQDRRPLYRRNDFGTRV